MQHASDTVLGFKFQGETNLVKEFGKYGQGSEERVPKMLGK